MIKLNRFPPICPHCYVTAYEFVDMGIEWLPDGEVFDVYICRWCLGKLGVATHEFYYN